MERIETYDNAVEVARKCNANFGGNDISAEDNAGTFVSELNNGFVGIEGASILSNGDFASEFIEELNSNFDLFDSQGGDDIGEHHTFSFLHASDSHGIANTIRKAKEIIDDDDDDANLFIHSGDIYNDTYGSSDTTITNLLASMNGKILSVPGNHDIAKTFGGGSTGSTNFRSATGGQNDYMANSVVWGGDNVCYWHKDISNVDGKGGKLRIIGLNDFQGSTGTASNIASYYTQTQLEWFAARLKELNASDYFFVVEHYPPFRNVIESYDYTLAYPSDKNLFLTDYINSRGNNVWVVGIGSLAQVIVDSYLNKQNKKFRSKSSISWDNVQVDTTNAYGGYRYKNDGNVYLNANSYGVNLATSTFDFSSASPATFLFFLNGHIHGDVTHYLRDFPYLLSLNIETSSTQERQQWAWDVDRNDNRNKSLVNGSLVWVALNKVTIDFTDKKTTIQRVGNVDNERYGGQITRETGILETTRHRKTITFPFVNG